MRRRSFLSASLASAGAVVTKLVAAPARSADVAIDERLNRPQSRGSMVRNETPQQTDARLLKVIAATQLVVLELPYAYLPLAIHQQPSPVALACVRDGDKWFQLVPVSLGPASEPRYRVFSFHFAESLNASGFVGWLASHMKRTLGTGVIVICGKDRRSTPALNAASLGVFDYWGCPFEEGDAVLGEVHALVAQGLSRA